MILQIIYAIYNIFFLERFFIISLISYLAKFLSIAFIISFLLADFFCMSKNILDQDSILFLISQYLKYGFNAKMVIFYTITIAIFASAINFISASLLPGNYIIPTIKFMTLNERLNSPILSLIFIILEFCYLSYYKDWISNDMKLIIICILLSILDTISSMCRMNRNFYVTTKRFY